MKIRIAFLILESAPDAQERLLFDKANSLAADQSERVELQDSINSVAAEIK